MNRLGKAIAVAAIAHQDQVRFDGSPYMLHCIRVMMRLSGESEMICGICHDTIEDTEMTLEKLNSLIELTKEEAEAIDILTHKDCDSYDEYIQKVSQNALAKAVKISDLRDNMDLLGLPKLIQKDLLRAERYHKSFLALTGTPVATEQKGTP